VNAGQPAKTNKSVGVKALVDYVLKADSNRYRHAAFKKKLLTSVCKPMKQNLSEILQGEEDGLSKNELLTSFKGTQGISRWELVCFFYSCGGGDMQSQSIEF